MRHYSFIFIIFFSVLMSCTSKISKNEASQNKIDTTINTEILVGGDLDEHGCKGSAGYTLSKVLNNCIRIWESGIQLKPIENDGAIFNATIIFSKEKDTAELFINTKKSSILLSKNKDDSYKNGEYSLIETIEGWLLKSGNKEIYKNF